MSVARTALSTAINKLMMVDGPAGDGVISCDWGRGPDKPPWMIKVYKFLVHWICLPVDFML